MAPYSSSAILSTLFLLLCTSTLLTADAALRAPDVTIYIFQTNPPVANAPAVAIYPPGILAPYPVGIPIVTVGDQPIGLTASEQSQIVGRQRFIRVTGDTQDDQAWIQSTGVLDLKINGRNGTMSYSGISSLSTDINIPTAEDLCITSGTGAYESASGRSKIALIGVSGYKTIVEWELYLCYPELGKVYSLLG